METTKRQSAFNRFAQAAARATGHPLAFLLATAIVIVWAAIGPFVGFHNTWQLIINSLTTVVTFLMVFLIQNTQNRDSEAVQIKLDELIRATKGAHNALLDLEELDEAELHKIRAEYEKLAQRAREALNRGEADTDAPEVE